MDLTGEFTIPASREAVWRALNDPEILKQCIPGCETVDKVSDTEFTARVVLRIGPMSAKFAGKVTLSDLDPPNGYKISGEGQGGVAGFAKGSAEVKLASEGNATVLRYKSDAQVGGKMAQLGARLIESTSKKLANDFFAKFAELVGGPAAAAPAAEAPAAAAAPAGAETGRIKPAVWIPVLIAVILLIWWWFAT